MENLLTDGDSPQICTKEEMQEYSKANRLMRSCQYDQAIHLFSNHYQVLLSKKELFQHDQTMMESLRSSLELVASYLLDLRQSSLNQPLSKGWVPVNDNLERALESYEPVVKETLMQIVNYPLPGVTMDNTIGMKNAKETLNRCLFGPLQHGNLYQTDESTSKGILLYGMPGCGKTRLSFAALNQVKDVCTIMVVESGTLFSKWSGTAQKLVDGLFRFAAESSPSLIFIDECDVVMQSRDSKKETSESLRHWQTSMLQNMDKPRQKGSQIYVISTTNAPWALDRAFSRRFGVKIYVPPPTMEEREPIIKSMVGSNNCVTELEWSLNFNELI